MPKVSPIQSNFNGGEISPLLYGRVDIPRYKESLAICENYLPLIQGPITRRPGSAFVFPVKDSTAVTRLIPFEFSTTQAYMIEFGNNYIRFFKNNGIIANATKNITAITQASPGVLTSASHGFSNGDHVVIAGISGMTELNNREFTVANSLTNTFTLVDNITGVAVDTTSDTTYSSGGTAGKIYEVTTHRELKQGLISGVTKANPASVTCAGHGLTNGQIIEIQDVVGMTQLNGNQYTITVSNSSTFTLNTDSTGFTTYTSGGVIRLINSGTYLTADLPTIKYTQSDDVLYLVHPSYKPRKLIRNGDNNWSLQALDFIDGPYLDQNTTPTLFSTDQTGVPGTAMAITASSIVGINNDTGFQSTDVGRLIRWLNADASWGYAIINTVTDTKTIVALALNTTTGGASSTSSWRLGIWSDTSGYPASVVFHEDRLVFGGAAADPTRFDGSKSGDYENFAPSGTGFPVVLNSGSFATTGSSATIANNNAYAFPLVSNDVNSILWKTSDEQGLVIGTTGGEWLITSSSNSIALSPTSVSAKKMTAYGSENVQAVQSGKCSLFVQRGARKIRELNYYFDVNGFRAADLTQISEHISQSGINFLAAQKTPQSIVWGVRDDGVLLAMTYERDLDALKVGWSRHIMGGTVSGGANPIVESVAIIPSADGEFQDVWLIVQRLINGHTVRYIEYLTQLFDDATDIKDAFFVDAGLTYNGSATTTISGLNHLNGQTVSILADGTPVASQGVVNGKITLAVAASKVTVGLGYNSSGQVLRKDAGAADGTAMGKTRRTHRTGIQFLNTLGFKLGPDFDSLDDIVLDDVADANFDSAQGLYTGIRSEVITTDYDFDNMFCFRQTQPLPGTILGIYPQMVEQDR